MGFESSYGSGGGLSPLMIALIAVFGIILLGAIGRGIFVWMRNNNSPRETVNARVVTKRMKVSGHGTTMMRTDTAMNRMGSSTYTRYFVTFELENGGRVVVAALARHQSEQRRVREPRWLPLQPQCRH